MKKLVWVTAGLLGIVCGALWRGAVFAQGAMWDTCMKAALRASQHGHAPEAARLYQIAIRHARRFGPHDPRLAASLAALADFDHHQGDDTQAASLYQQALTAGETTLGPDDPTITACRRGLAALPVRKPGSESTRLRP